MPLKRVGESIVVENGTFILAGDDPKAMAVTPEGFPLGFQFDASLSDVQCGQSGSGFAVKWGTIPLAGFGWVDFNADFSGVDHRVVVVVRTISPGSVFSVDYTITRA